MLSEISDKKPLEIEKRLRLLHKIVSQKSFDLNEHLYQALKLTTKLLGMEVGILSSTNGDVYTVKHHYSVDDNLENGQTFDLGDTYCSITLDSNKVVAINNMQKSPHKRHPCYEVFKLESYIGVPIYIDGSLYGTLNFSSSQPKRNKFIEADKTLIKLLAEWASSVIKRNKVKEDLIESERLYKLISTNSAEMICLHDPDGTFKFVSPSSKNLTGYEPPELLGKNPYDFHHPEDVKKIQKKSHSEALHDNVIQSLQYRFKRKDGEYIWLDTATQPITNDKGEVISLQTTSREITQRKRLEILFSQAEKMAQLGGWEYDVKTGDMVWTDQVYRIHELPLRGKIDIEKGLSFYPESAREKIEDALEYTMETGKQYDLTLPFVTAKGNKIWVRAIGQAQFSDGKPYKLRGTFQDITQQKESEQRIKDQNRSLKKLTSTRDKLYSIIGHDLKNTFFGSLGLIDIMKEEKNSEDHSEEEFLQHLDLLQSTINNAYELLENLLDWIRMQREEVIPEFRDVNIAELIEESVSVYQAVATNKSISLETDIGEMTPIKGDSEMLKTCLRNLISNALKFSGNGSVIRISASSVKDKAIVRVKDWGIGMPPEVKGSLFDPAHRPKRQGTQNERGTGLGLLLCNEFIKLHGGSIEVESEVGKGSEFIVALPKAHP